MVYLVKEHSVMVVTNHDVLIVIQLCWLLQYDDLRGNFIVKRYPCIIMFFKCHLSSYLSVHGILSVWLLLLVSVLKFLCCVFVCAVPYAFVCICFKGATFSSCIFHFFASALIDKRL